MSLAAIMSLNSESVAVEVVSMMVELSLDGGVVLHSVGNTVLWLDWKWKEKTPSDEILFS